MDHSDDAEQEDIICELGHLAWVIKHVVRSWPVIAYGFIDGLSEIIMKEAGCPPEEMANVAHALRMAFNEITIFGWDKNILNDDSAEAARKVCR